MDNPYETERLEGRKLRVVVAEVIKVENTLGVVQEHLLSVLSNIGRFLTISQSKTKAQNKIIKGQTKAEVCVRD